MKYQIFTVGGLGMITDPKKLQKYLEDEGCVFVDKDFVKKHEKCFASLCQESVRKSKSEYLLTGRCGNFGQFKGEPLKFEAVRVIKNHNNGKYQIEWGYVHEASAGLVIVVQKPQKATQEHNFIIAQS